MAKPSGGKTGDLFTFSFDPDLASIRFGFEDWSRLVSDWTPAWDNIATLFRKHEDKHFETEGVSTGARFPELRNRPDGKPGYRAWKQRHYPGLPILQREKVLFRALVEGGQGSMFEKTKTSMAIGIKPGVTLQVKGKKYALWKAARAHALGLGLPQRPPIRFNSDVRNRSSFAYAISQLMQAQIVKTRRRAFKGEIEDAIGGPAGAITGADRTISSVLSRDWS